MRAHGPALTFVVVCALLFHALPLLSTTTSPHWDAIDAHYAEQEYFSSEVRAGRLPFWTPYVFAGFPFLAEPTVGAWYVLNWPFFLAGVTPRTIEYELALHTLIASVGTYVLAVKLQGDRTAATVAALLYGMSGFFGAQSQAVGLYKAAAWFPSMLLVARQLQQRLSIVTVAIGGLLGASVVLSGHFQTALYAFAAMGLFALLTQPRGRGRWGRLFAGLVGMAGLTLALSAVQTLPGLELVHESVRPDIDAAHLAAGYLVPEALLTLVWPDALGALFGPYHGPPDITQYYWYDGVLLVPLVIAGWLAQSWRERLPSIALLGPFGWYALGPPAGLYLVVAALPGFHSVRAPVNGWFIASLGLALLAGAGFAQLARLRFGRRVRPVLLLCIVGDLVFWNSVANGVAFARDSPDVLYIAPRDAAQAKLAAIATTGLRVHGPPLTRLGYLNSSLQMRVEATYGYDPLELRRYATYIAAAETNPRLVDGLAATAIVRVTPNGTLESVTDNPGALPFAYAARRIVVDSEIGALEGLDPAQATLVDSAATVGEVDSEASVAVVDRGLDRDVLHYRAAGPILIRVAIPWFPGWHASADGVDLPVLPADTALLGVLAPPGERDVVLSYDPLAFRVGASITLLTLAGLCLALVWAGLRERRRRPDSNW